MTVHCEHLPHFSILWFANQSDMSHLGCIIDYIRWSLFYLFCRFANEIDELNIHSTTGMLHSYWAADSIFARHNMYIS